MPKRCVFDDRIECFAEGCYAECRHHPHSGYIYLKEGVELKEKPKKHRKLKKVLDILGWIVIAPVFLIFLLLCWVLRLDIDFDRLSDKELVGYMLLVYGVAVVLALLYFSPPLYLPPNLAIIALFLGIGGPIIGVVIVVIYTKMKKREGEAEAWDFKVTWDLEGQAKDQATSELGYDLLELKEQLGKGAITQEEYERKKKLLEGLADLKLQLGRGDITFEEYHQKKRKLLEKIEQYKQTQLGE